MIIVKIMYQNISEKYSIILILDIQYKLMQQIIDNQDFRKERQFYYTTIASLGALYCWFQVFKLQADLLLKSSNRRRINGYDVYDPQGIQNHMNNLSKVNGQIESKPVFVNGVSTLSNGNSNNGTLWGKSSLPLNIYQLYCKQPLYSNSAFNDPQLNVSDLQNNELETRITFEPKFMVVDKPRQHFITVNLARNTDVTTALTKQGYTDVKRRLSLPEYAAHYFTLIYMTSVKTLGFYGLSQALTRDLSFRGVHLGYRESQFAIQAEGWISVLGKVIYDTTTKTFSIDNPILLTLSKEDHVKYLSEQIDSLKQRRNVWLLGSLVLSIYLGRRAFKYYRQNSQQVDELWARIKRFFYRSS